MVKLTATITVEFEADTEHLAGIALTRGLGGLKHSIETGHTGARTGIKAGSVKVTKLEESIEPEPIESPPSFQQQVSEPHSGHRSKKPRA